MKTSGIRSSTSRCSRGRRILGGSALAAEEATAPVGADLIHLSSDHRSSLRRRAAPRRRGADVGGAATGRRARRRGEAPELAAERGDHHRRWRSCRCPAGRSASGSSPTSGRLDAARAEPARRHSTIAFDVLQACVVASSTRVRGRAAPPERCAHGWRHPIEVVADHRRSVSLPIRSSREARALPARAPSRAYPPDLLAVLLDHRASSSPSSLRIDSICLRGMYSRCCLPAADSTSSIACAPASRRAGRAEQSAIPPLTSSVRQLHPCAKVSQA